MNDRQKCLICNNPGKKIYSLPIKSHKLISFFLNYYKNKKLVKNFLSKIKNYRYILLKCYECKFIWQKYSLQNKLQNELYEKLISPKKSLEKSKKNLEIFKKRFNSEFNFFKEINYKKDFKVLDYGAGWGNWILSLNYDSKNIFALENSQKRIKYLKMKKINVISFNYLKKKKPKFDFVRLEQVLEHIEDFDYIFKNFKKILKKDGFVYISVPNSKILFSKNWINNLLIKGPAQPLEHLNSFTPISLNKLLKKYDYKKISPIFLFKAFIMNKKFSLEYIKIVMRIIFNNYYTTSILFKIK